MPRTSGVLDTVAGLTVENAMRTEAFLSDNPEYGDALLGRRHAATDRGHAKVDRSRSADDREKLTEDTVGTAKPGG